MDFNQIRYFLALAKTLNFTRAAEQCNVSQPALTQSIKRMEQELGGELISRDGRYTELTELGKSLLFYFEQIDKTRDLVRSTANAITAGESTELNIGIMCTLGPQVLGEMLEKFQMQNPNISVVLHDVILSRIPELLLSGAINCAFCSGHNVRNDVLCYEHLFQEPMVAAFVCGHPLSKLEEVPMMELSKYPYLDRLLCEFRLEFIKHCKEKNCDLNIVFSSQREDWIQSLLINGVGISAVPKYSILCSELEYRKIVEPPIFRQVEFAYLNQTNLSPTLSVLADYVKHYNWPTD